MNVGNLHKVIVFKQNNPTVKGAGKADAYTTLLTTRGSLKKLNGNRGLSFGELLESNSYEMITRHQQALEDNLRMDMKIDIEGRTFTIQSYDKVQGKRFYYRFILNEQRN
jgi:hypothetical protein